MPAYTASNGQDLNININNTSFEELKNLNNGQTNFDDNEEKKENKSEEETTKKETTTISEK
uniref:Uncharacterized protein n=1 Tax=Meloidogyne hapla TaxID=6305 RepID=A0A1I8BJC3_MELHA